MRLARILKRFGVKPKQLRIDGKKERGYERGDLEPVWERYTPTRAEDPQEDGTNGTDRGTSEVSDGASDQQRTDSTDRTVSQDPLPVYADVGEDGTAEVAPAAEFQPGDIVRVDQYPVARFKVETANNGTVHAWELELGVAVRLRVFEAAEVTLVQRVREVG